MDLLLTAAAALCFAGGGVYMKLSDGLTRPGPAGAVFLLFAAGAALQAVALRKANLGAGYLTVLGLEGVLAFGFGVAFFREGCSPVKVLGVAAVVVGVILLHAGEG